MKRVIKCVILIFLTVNIFVINNVLAEESETLPHYDNNGVAFVTYEDFGAKCDGEYDDFLAIKSAHEFANSNNCEVRATKNKTYHIFNYDGETASVSTNVDWCDANFIIHDEEIEKYEAKNKYLFTIYNTKKETVINNPNWTVGKNTKSIPELEKIVKDLGYNKYFCMAENADKKQYIRYGSNANAGENQQDYFIIDNKCKVLNDIAWDFDKLTAFKLYPIIDKEIEIKNGNFVTNANTKQNPTGVYFSRNICVYNSSNVTISGITHKSTDKDCVNSAYYGFIFAKNSSNLTIKDCELLARKYNVEGRSTYDLVINTSANVTCKNIVCNDILDEDRWGIVETAYAKDVTFENCTLNRIDAHQGIYNLTVKDCEIGASGFTLIGQGTANIINTKVTSNQFITLRQDYGSSWNGDINLINCTYKCQGQYAPKIFNFKFSYDENKKLHDFGYTCKFPNVYVENLTIDLENVEDRNKVYIIPNFESMLGEGYSGNPEYWAERIYINGYKIINNKANATLEMSVNEIDKLPNKIYDYIINKDYVSKRGDIDNNGTVDINDIAILKLHLIDKRSLTMSEEIFADIDLDGKIGINDLAALKRKIIN